MDMPYLATKANKEVQEKKIRSEQNSLSSFQTWLGIEGREKIRSEQNSLSSFQSWLGNQG